MQEFKNNFNRRLFLKGAGAAAGAGALSMTPIQMAFAAAFPERNIQIFVPTRAGGGADRNMRAFTSVWKNYLKTNFEAGFYPGAAGRVGYETYMGKAKADCYNLIFGNMGPEVLNWVVKNLPLILIASFTLRRWIKIQELSLSARKTKSLRPSTISSKKGKRGR